MSKEAMKLALEALESQRFSKVIEAKNALEEALAKQEQVEPVAWCRYEDGMWVYYETKAWDDLQPLYTTPQQRTWVGLDEEEQGAIMESLNAYGTNLYHFANAIEAKLKEKNT